MSAETLNSLEIAVLQMLLAGEHQVLVTLRAQLSGLTVKTRKLTGVGFFTEFSVADGVQPTSVPGGSLRFGDVEATISGLRNGAGFVLYVDGGVLTMLEGYTYDEPWPDEIKTFFLRYWDQARKRLLTALGESPSPM